MKKTIFLIMFSAAMAATDAYTQVISETQELLNVESADRNAAAAEAEQSEIKKIRQPFLPPPEGTIFFEAESMDRPLPSQWTERYIKYTDWHDGVASGFKTMTGINQSKGNQPLRKTVELKKDGAYRIWACFIDHKTGINPKTKLPEPRTGCLDFNMSQNGKVIKCVQMGRVFSPLSNDAGISSYGVRNSTRQIFVWQGGRFDAKAGKLDIEMTGSGGYMVDCIVISNDLTYEPRLPDFTPLWLKVKVSKEQKVPMAVRIGDSNYITKKGMMKAGEAQIMQNQLAPGEESPWVYVSRFFGYFSHKIKLTASTDAKNEFYSKKEKEAAFEVIFSTSPDERSEIYREERKRDGDSLILSVGMLLNSDKPPMMGSDSRMAENARTRAEALNGIPGKYPERFFFTTQLALGPSNGMELLSNELTALTLCGVNSGYHKSWDEVPAAKKYIDREDVPHDSGLAFAKLFKDCPCTPDLRKIAASAEKYENTMGKKGVVTFNDEPFGPSMKCQKCISHYREFLKRNKVSPAELGMASIDEAYLTDKKTAEAQAEDVKSKIKTEEDMRSPNELNVDSGKTDDSLAGMIVDTKFSREKAAARYYWSNRYNITVLRSYYKICTDAITKANPNVLTTFNNATELIYNGNSVERGLDIFDMYENGGVTCGGTEDWANLSGNYAVVGYQTNVLRGACRKKNIPFGMLNVMEDRSSEEIQAKAYSTIGRGTTSLFMFNYGPSYTGAPQSTSNRPEILETIKRITFPTGVVEKYLFEGKVASGDVGHLLSVTSDIWNRGNFFGTGRERIWTSLLLSHCGVRSDVFNEEGMREQMADYRTIVINDSHVRKEFLSDILSWVKAGGNLVVTGGALQLDEYEKALGFDEAVGIIREKARTSQENEDSELEKQKISVREKKEKFENNLKKADVPVVVKTSSGELKLSESDIRSAASNGRSLFKDDRGRNAVSVFEYGKGKVIVFSWWPGTLYHLTSDHEKDAYESKRIYHEPSCEIMKSVMKECGVTPRIMTDDPMVEAMLIESEKADVIVLSNWRGEPRKGMKTVLRDAPEYKNISSVAGQVVKTEKNGNQLVITSDMSIGDYIICTK